MNQVEVIFGVYERDGEIILESQAVSKNTPKQIILKSRMRSYEYRKRLWKERDHIFYVPEDAIRYFIRERMKQITDLQTNINELNYQIAQAQELLKVQEEK